MLPDLPEQLLKPVGLFHPRGRLERRVLNVLRVGKSRKAAAEAWRVPLHAQPVQPQVEIGVGENVLRRRVRTDGSYLSGNDPRVLVGLGTATSVKTVKVIWPSGTVEEWKDLAVDQYTTLKEGTARR